MLLMLKVVLGIVLFALVVLLGWAAFELNRAYLRWMLT